MHRLDGHINDIEPRIVAIYDNVAKQEEPSLQESLSSYGWILLDSWVAWRTLRFLLREIDIADNVHEKWFQIPSSYTANQLKAIWNFSDIVLNYVKEQTGKSFIDLINNTIQKKRNSSAHFTTRAEITGMDANEIKKIYLCFSKIFLFYETEKFLQRLDSNLERTGCADFCVRINNNTYPVNNFYKSFEQYVDVTEFFVEYVDKNKENRVLVFNQGGCYTRKKIDTCSDEVDNNVINDKVRKYYFFGNKGFYRDIELFISSVNNSYD